MPCVRHLIVCEGESEHAYLQRLQSFLEAQPLPNGAFEPPLRFIGPSQAVAKGGEFKTLKTAYTRTRKDNKTAPSIQVWADFDIYHRDDKACAKNAKNYATKPTSIPTFLFSFHNFEDFLALHCCGAQLAAWRHYGSQKGKNHFAAPLQAKDYVKEMTKLFPGYQKGALSPDFLSWDSLRNLKANLCHQPSSNPHGLKDIRSFAGFLIEQLERAYPNALKNPAPVLAATPPSSS